MYNQGNYQQFGQRLPDIQLPPPHSSQQGPTASRHPPPLPSYLIPSPQNSNWNQNQHISPPIGLHLTPRVPPPHPQGQHFYSVPPPPSSSYFTPASLGSFIQPPNESSLGQLPPPPPLSPPSSVANMVASGETDTLRHETSIKDTLDFDITLPPPKPRDEETVRKIEVLCQYIAKNGHEFENMTCQKQVDNPEFKFLFGGEPGSEAAISHEYFKWMKKKCRSSELLEGMRNSDISLEPLGVGASMQPDDTLQAGLSHSPTGSDMDMEDDITQPEESGVGKSFGNTNGESAFISNEEVDIKVEEHACDLEHISHKDVTDVSILYTESSGVIQQEKHKIDLRQETNLSDAAKVSSSEAPDEEGKGTSPFKLIQGYASADSSESDDDPHFENISPVAVSPQHKEDTRNLQSKNSSEDLEKKPGSYLIDGGRTCIKNLKQNNNIGGDDAKNRVAQKDDNNTKLEVDEFGRMVKADGSDSESDHSRRRRKRGRSRSRSPKGRRRRRSPLRRREKRSRSRSWSPKKRRRSRSRSRSPYRRGGDTGSRRNRSPQPICHDFRLGKCFRGASCKYIHDTARVEESRHHNNRRHYQDRRKSLDKLSPEKDVNDSLETQQLYEGLDKTGNKAKQELPESSAHSTETAHEPSGTLLSPPEPQPPFPSLPTSSYPPFSSQHPQLSLPPATLWNSLPPPPPRPQPLPPYQQNQPPFQVNYPFIQPYPPMNYPISQQPIAPMVFSEENFTSPSLISRYNLQNPVASTLQEPGKIISDFGQSRISTHYNPYASTFDQPLSTKFSSGAFTQDTGTSTPYVSQNPVGAQYDPLFDSINHGNNSKNEEETEVGENDAEVGAVENDSPSSPIDLADVATGDIEIDQVKSSGKTKDSRSMKLFKVALADFVKEVLKPSWRQGNMSKEAFKTIVKKTVDKVSGAMKKHQLPKSQAKINQYIDSSQRKLTKLVMGYVDKYVKV